MPGRRASWQQPVRIVSQLGHVTIGAGNQPEYSLLLKGNLVGQHAVAER
jgi:hypothetical protein